MLVEHMNIYVHSNSSSTSVGNFVDCDIGKQ